MQVIQVDHISLQSAQAVFAIASERFRTPIDHPLESVGKLHTGHTSLAGQCDCPAVRFEHPPEQLFVVAKAVQSSGVKQRNAGIQRCQQNPLALLGRNRRAVGMAEVHAAQANGADLEGPDLSVLHG